MVVTTSTISGTGPHMHLNEVSPGVFAYVQPDGTWWINNAGFIVGSEGVILIDTCATEQRTRQLLATIRSVTDAPVHVVVNTHHHGDHTHGKRAHCSGGDHLAPTLP